MKSKSSASISPKTQQKKSAAASRARKPRPKVTGYGKGTVSTIISVDQVAKEINEISHKSPSAESLRALSIETPAKRGKSPRGTKKPARGKLTGIKKSGQAPKKSPVRGEETSEPPFLHFSQVTAGYGKMTILSEFNLFLEKGQSLCLIGPNGAGKSTILHTLYGMTNIFNGSITLEGKDITSLPPNEKLRQMGVAYLLQENSVFPDMTIEENLLMGGFLMESKDAAAAEMERILEHYSRLRKRRHQKASVLSGGERRLLEISRALMMNPRILLVDEPSIGLEPKFIDMVFEILRELRDHQNKTILMVEQNAKKGLEFADLAYVLVSGRVALAGAGDDLLSNPHVGRLFLGG